MTKICAAGGSLVRHGKADSVVLSRIIQGGKHLIRGVGIGDPWSVGTCAVDRQGRDSMVAEASKQRPALRFEAGEINGEDHDVLLRKSALHRLGIEHRG